MKLLILSAKMPFPPKDGGAVATLNIAYGLAETGIEVTLMCLNTLKHFYHEDKLPYHLTNRIKFICVKHDTSIQYHKAFFNLIFSGKPYIATRFISKNFKEKLSYILKNERFDIIQLEGPYMAWYIPVIKSFSTAKISLRAHNIESEIWERKLLNETNVFKKLYFLVLAGRVKKFEEEIISKIDILVPVTKEVESYILSLKNSISSLVSPTGLDIENYPVSIPRDPPGLFYIGSLEWIPNQEGLCWFLEKVWKNNFDNSLLHVAGRRAPDWLKEKLQNCPGIIFHGEVDNAIGFMSRYDALICPLLSGSGIRIKILEAMLLGKVVITSPVGAEGIPVKDGENILLANNDKEFVLIIKSLLEEPGSFIQIGTNARKLISENFNNLALCKKLNGFYLRNLK